MTLFFVGDSSSQSFTWRATTTKLRRRGQGRCKGGVGNKFTYIHDNNIIYCGDAACALAYARHEIGMAEQRGKSDRYHISSWLFVENCVNLRYRCTGAGDAAAMRKCKHVCTTLLARTLALFINEVMTPNGQIKPQACVERGFHFTWAIWCDSRRNAHNIQLNESVIFGRNGQNLSAPIRSKYGRTVANWGNQNSTIPPRPIEIRKSVESIRPYVVFFLVCWQMTSADKLINWHLIENYIIKVRCDRIHKCTNVCNYSINIFPVMEVTTFCTFLLACSRRSFFGYFCVDIWVEA